MRFLLRCLVLLVVAVSAEAATPSLSCSYSTTGGSTSPAPLFVHVDCTATTDADTSKPFHDLQFRHTFGDPGAGTWSNGANTNASKNVATGAIAGHVYETAGTYTITTTVTDGTNIARTTQSITVADPDTVYTGTATVCFYNSTVGTGCPAGATQTASSDYDAALTSCFGTTKRCLFKRGDTFTASAATGLASAGPNTIGAYGSGALPVVNMTANDSLLNITTGTNDLRIMDINFVGSGSGAAQKGLNNGANVSGITVLRVTATNFGAATIGFGTGSFTVTNTVVQDSTLTGSAASIDLYMRIASGGAVLGNVIGPTGPSGFQALRLDRWQRSVVAHNTITHGGAATVNVVALRAQAHVTTAEDSFYDIFSDNKIIEGTITPGAFVAYGPIGGSDDARIYDQINERNWYVSSAYTGASAVQGLVVSAVRATVRNNLFDLSLPVAGLDRVGISVGKVSSEPTPDDVQLLNNTIYSSQTGAAAGSAVRIFTSTNTVVKNTLCRAVSMSKCVDNVSGTGVVTATNSSNAQMTGTDPSFDNTASPPSGFRIGTGSYAATGGTALFPSSNSDFFDCDDTTANEHIGAFVPRVRARCRSAAGP